MPSAAALDGPLALLLGPLSGAGVAVHFLGVVGNPYRFTVKPMALLLPDAVATATFTAPYLAFGGTLHLICASL